MCHMISIMRVPIRTLFKFGDTVIEMVWVGLQGIKIISFWITLYDDYHANYDCMHLKIDILTTVFEFILMVDWVVWVMHTKK